VDTKFPYPIIDTVTWCKHSQLFEVDDNCSIQWWIFLSVYPCLAGAVVTPTEVYASFEAVKLPSKATMGHTHDLLDFD